MFLQKPTVAGAPPFRRLRGYAVDRSFSTQLETAVVNHVVFPVRWEALAAVLGETEPRGPGPVGEYVEVIDIDPPSQCLYTPVDLNDPHLLAQDGLAPS